MSQKRSLSNTISLRLGPEVYNLARIASAHYTDKDGNKVTMAEFCRQMVAAGAQVVLKDAGVYDKVVGEWKNIEIGRQLVGANGDGEVELP